MEENKRGRGRPKEENTCDYMIHARFDKRDRKKLEQIVKATGDTKADILRTSLQGYWVYLYEKGVIKDE